MSHLLVTNDFPPKVGGIQTYLWELWRRLPPGECTVLTTPYPGAAEFDAAAPMRIVRTPEKVLLPTRSLARRINVLARETGASLAVLDPALPLGLVGRRLDIPYAVVLHGAEVTVPGRLPGSRSLLRRVLIHACGLVAAGSYPAAEAHRLTRELPPVVTVPPGVDAERFRPLDTASGTTDPRTAAREARHHFDLPHDAELVVSVSRLVPRKGMDTLLRAAAQIAPRHPRLLVVIAGAGRDAPRLHELAESTGAPVRFAGKVPGSDLPLLYGCADLFVMVCRDRWAGLEQEGFGVVFLEAAACGVPQIAGRSGGSHEAVEDGVTGYVLGRAAAAGGWANRAGAATEELAATMEKLLADPAQRSAMGEASRRRVERCFGYDHLGGSLLDALRGFEGGR